MRANIDAVVDRGERMELIVDRAEALSNESVRFRTGARNVRRQMWWENTKVKVVVALIVLVVIYAIVSASCGGLDWPKCV